MFELRLDNTSIPVGENFGDQFKASYVLGTPLSPQSRGNSVVREIIIPASPQMNDFLEHAYVARPYEGNSKEIFSAVVTESGSTLFKGNCTVKYIHKNGDMPDGYSILLTSGAAEWDDELKNYYLSSLDWTDHDFSESNVTDTWSSTDPNLQYRYIPIQYGKWGAIGGGGNDVVHVENLRPSLSWHHILKKSLRHIGYDLVSDFFDSNYFRKLYLPFFGNFQHAEDYGDEIYFEASRSTNYTLTATSTLAIFDTEIADPSNSYNTGTGIYTIPNNGLYAFGGTITLEWISGSPAAGRFFVDVYKNGNFVDIAFHKSYGLDSTTTTITFNLDTLDKERKYFDFATGDTAHLRFRHVPISGSARIKSGSKIKSIPGREILLDAEYDLSSVLDSSIPLNELIKDIFTMFNIQTYTDSARKIVYAEPYDDFYYDHKVNYVDWTSKIHIGETLKRDQLLTAYKDRVKFQFANDGNDAMVKDWEEQNKDRYQSQEIELSEGFTKGEYIIETKHIAPTMQGSDTVISAGEVSIPILWKDVMKGTDFPEYSNDFKPRVIYYEGLESNQQWHFMTDSRTYTVTTLNGRTYNIGYTVTGSESSWPKSYAVNPDAELTPYVSLSWKDYEGRSPGLYHTFWRNFIRNVDEGYLLTCKANITTSDIASLWDDGSEKSLWRKPVWVRDRWFVLYEIKDFNPEIREPVEIVLFTYDPGQAVDPANTTVYGKDHYPGDKFPIKKPPRAIWGEGSAVDDENMGLATPGIRGTDTTTVLENGTGNKGIKGQGQTIIGSGNIAVAQNQNVVGNFNDPKAAPIFIIGGGSSEIERYNALEVYINETNGLPYVVSSKKVETIDTDGAVISDSTELVYFDSSGGALPNIDLPAHADYLHEYLTLADLGDAGTNNVQINADGTDTISGDGFTLLNTDYQVKVLYKSPTAGLWLVK